MLEVLEGGGFPEDELQSVEVNKDTTFPIESILDEKFENGKRYLLVKWEGFPRKCASWVEKNTVKNI